MHVPNGQRAVVDSRKLTDYCLNPDHPMGRHEARVLRAALGFTVADAPALRAMLLEAVREEQATPGIRDKHGVRCVVDFAVRTPGGKVYLRTGWIIRTGEDVHRLTTCYVR